MLADALEQVANSLWGIRYTRYHVSTGQIAQFAAKLHPVMLMILKCRKIGLNEMYCKVIDPENKTKFVIVLHCLPTAENPQLQTSMFANSCC